MVVVMVIPEVQGDLVVVDLVEMVRLCQLDLLLVLLLEQIIVLLHHLVGEIPVE
jgi:hypothetical protein